MPVKTACSAAAKRPTKIEPAVRNAQARGWDVKGPLPADTLFFLAARGDYDIVVAMYHDQGHGPIKVLGLEAGVNITVGLPMVRTSVDHGTAFDIAGTRSGRRTQPHRGTAPGVGTRTPLAFSRP